MTRKLIGSTGCRHFQMLLLMLFGAMSQSLGGTLTVTNLSDSGPGTLRDRLASASPGDLINFALTGTISLAGVELTVSKSLTISGPGPEVLSVSANRQSRVFTVTGGPSQISGLTIRDGAVVGGSGQQGNNGFDAFGGGIYNNTNNLVLSNCFLLSNSVTGGAGADRHLANVGHGGAGLGGGVYTIGNLSIVNCVVAGNTASGGHGGNGLTGSPGFGGDGEGGAIYAGSGTHQITGCTVAGNVVLGGPGGTSNSSSGGGGQALGAGLFNQSTVLVSGSTFSSGRAVAGTNAAAFGGAIYNLANLGIYSSTIASNAALGAFTYGGGIHNSVSLGITNSTIAGNQAQNGGGLNGNAIAANTIFAANSATAGPDANGTLTSFDYNLIQNASGTTISGASTHVLIGTDPLLGPLRDNGGPTWTMELLTGSPAIDQGSSFGRFTDQRGALRIYDLPSVANGGNGADIGAFEFVPTPRLEIQRANGSVLLSWSTDAADFQLQSAPSLPALAWVEVTNSRAVLGDRVYVTNAAAGTSALYRLSLPLLVKITP